MDTHNIIVIGASSGGVEALIELFRKLDAKLNAVIFIVVHIPTDAKSYLPNILSRLGSISVMHARDGERFYLGNAYIAPPNRHLFLEDGTMRVRFGPRENSFRPAVDPLFLSAAKYYGPRVIGVILSGNLHDGTKGLQAVKHAGGTAIVQDPEEALFPSMPASALQNISVDYTLPVTRIASLLNELTSEPVHANGDERMDQSINEGEFELIKQDFHEYEAGGVENSRSILTCPDCGGILWELKDDLLVRYRCHVGHVYSPESLLSSQNGELEKAFWSAIRVLVEKAALSNRLALRASGGGNQELEAYYLGQAAQAEKDADLIRRTWFRGIAEASRDLSAGEQANDEITRSAS